MHGSGVNFFIYFFGMVILMETFLVLLGSRDREFDSMKAKAS
jgi:hypothetical protein